MMSEYARMFTTMSQCYVAGLGATAQVGSQALRESSAEASYVARKAANALRVPEAQRAAALEDAAHTIFESQRRQLHGLRGLSAMWGMTALHQLDANITRDDDS